MAHVYVRKKKKNVALQFPNRENSSFFKIAQCILENDSNLSGKSYHLF